MNLEFTKSCRRANILRRKDFKIKFCIDKFLKRQIKPSKNKLDTKMYTFGILE